MAAGPPRVGRDAARAFVRIRAVPGSRIEVTIKAVSHWARGLSPSVSALVASSWFMTRRTGIHLPASASTPASDVFNLAGTDAVVRGYAGDSLLDTYEAERRPVAAFNVAHSLRNARKHRGIAEAMGLRPGQTEYEGWWEIEN
jgi:hypothetical protein